MEKITTQQRIYHMAGGRLPARFSLRSQHWFQWIGKCLETATSHTQNVSAHKFN
jgi:hypothetical protein